MKTHVLMISKVFPKTHKRAGKPTEFAKKIRIGEKKHTIRANYDLWEKRIGEVNFGIAKLSVREWEGMPYRSKQKELFVFLAGDGIGVQKLEHPDYFIYAPIDGNRCNWADIAENDGLSFKDFCDWFKNAGSKPMAIIHFTKLRY